MLVRTLLVRIQLPIHTNENLENGYPGLVQVNRDTLWKVSLIGMKNTKPSVNIIIWIISVLFPLKIVMLMRHLTSRNMIFLYYEIQG